MKKKIYIITAILLITIATLMACDDMPINFDNKTSQTTETQTNSKQSIITNDTNKTIYITDEETTKSNDTFEKEPESGTTSSIIQGAGEDTETGNGEIITPTTH